MDDATRDAYNEWIRSDDAAKANQAFQEVFGYDVVRMTIPDLPGCDWTVDRLVDVRDLQARQAEINAAYPDLPPMIMDPSIQCGVREIIQGTITYVPSRPPRWPNISDMMGWLGDSLREMDEAPPSEEAVRISLEDRSLIDNLDEVQARVDAMIESGETKTSPPMVWWPLLAEGVEIGFGSAERDSLIKYMDGLNQVVFDAMIYGNSERMPTTFKGMLAERFLLDEQAAGDAAYPEDEIEPDDDNGEPKASLPLSVWRQLNAGVEISPREMDGTHPPVDLGFNDDGGDCAGLMKNYAALRDNLEEAHARAVEDAAFIEKMMRERAACGVYGGPVPPAPIPGAQAKPDPTAPVPAAAKPAEKAPKAIHDMTLEDYRAGIDKLWSMGRQTI